MEYWPDFFADAASAAPKITFKPLLRSSFHYWMDKIYD